METLAQIEYTYLQLLKSQRFDSVTLDYAVLENQKPLLSRLAEMGNSSISVFDMHKCEHAFISGSFTRLFDLDAGLSPKEELAIIDSRVHPDDLFELKRNGVRMFEFILSVPVEQRLDYKLINEYRIKSANGYVRVIEQHQAMELDKDGNVWLALSILDLSPNQEPLNSINSQLFNFRTGALQPVQPLSENREAGLTKKEMEVLAMVKDGLLSKEISGRLSISVHTVNTHRQRILEKLGADNSLEAVQRASRMGLFLS